MIAIQVQVDPHSPPRTYWAPDTTASGDVVLVPVLATVIAIGSETSDFTPDIIRTASAAEAAIHP